MEPWLWLLVQLVTCCLAGAVALLWWLWLTRLRVDAPGPPTLPIIGNILDFCELPLTLSKMRDLQRRYGDLSRFYLGPVLVMVVAHPDDVQQVLLTTRQVDRDPFTTHAMRTFLGEGLLTINGRHWKEHRKLINTTFHPKLVEGFLEQFHRGGVYVCERLAATRGAATEVHPLAIAAALRTLCSTVIGVDPDLVTPDLLKEEHFSANMKEGMATVQKMMVRPWLLSTLVLGLTATGRSLFKCGQVLQDWANNCIAERSAASGKQPAKARLCLLDALLKPGERTTMPLSEVRGELVNMAMAGSETLSLTVVYALALLAFHPEWQDAVQKELTEVFGEGDDYLRAANMADLGRLKVLESVIKETLRMFAVTPLLPRQASQDLWLCRGRVLVPRGALLAVMPSLTHRMPEFFPDPHSFDPSRFLDGGDGGKRHMCSFLPFGLGPRNCVGGQYARLQLRVYLANILRRFRILPRSSREDLENNLLSVSLHTVTPIKVSCVPLQESNSQPSTLPE